MRFCFSVHYAELSPTMPTTHFIKTEGEGINSNETLAQTFNCQLAEHLSKRPL